MRRWLRRLSVLGLLGGAAGWFMRKRRSGSEADASDAAWPPLRLVDPIPPPASTTEVTSLTEVPSTTADEPEDADTAPHGIVSIAESGPDADTDDSGTAPTTGWMEPVDGVCPISHPIKANAQSMIFHVPGGRSYERTIAERCYGSGDAAVADGYRQAKV